MIQLQQRLRELSRDEFESLVHQFLQSRFPGAGIKKADGSGGDRGVDSFAGMLSDGPAIWQSKHFIDRIRRPQKRQILDSIKTAIGSFGPKRWTLCVPVDFRTEEHEWFQSAVVSGYKNRTIIELIQGSDILAELTHNRQLREAFFPNDSISNALTIRKIAVGNEGKSLEQKEQLAIEVAQQFLEGNIDLEPRLQPIVSIGLSQTPGVNRRANGLVFSVAKGNLAIDYFAREPQSYIRDPLSFQITLNRSHSKRLQQSINTGAPFKLPAGAILKLDSESPLLRELFQKPDAAFLGLEMRPLVPEVLAARDIPLRFVSGSPQETKELSYVPFKVTQVGRKEITLSSRSRLPVEISIKLKAPSSKGAKVSFRPIIPGADAIDLTILLEFVDSLERSGRLEVFSLDPPGPFFTEAGTFTDRLKIPPGLKKAVFDLAVVSRFFKIPLCIPEVITEQDLETIRTLRLIATGEPLAGYEISANLTKVSSLKESVLQFLGGMPVSIRMENPTGWQNIELFGKTLDVGPIIITAEDVTIIDGDRIRGEYLDAPEGAAIRWKGSCRGTCRFASAKTQDKSQPDDSQ